jgi:hypothetical protein
MDAAAELTVAKDPVNKAMLVDQAEAGELGRDNAGIEVHVVIARHLGLGAGNAVFNACFHFFGSWHQKRG